MGGRNGQTIASASCISLDSLRGELRRLTGDRTKKLREIKKMEFEIKMTEEELREYLHFRETKQLEHGETEAAIQELNDLSLTVMGALGKTADGDKVRILDEAAAMKALETAKSIFLR